MTKKYNCSIHGNEGNPDCKECRDNLKKLAEDNNAIIFGDFEWLKRFHNKQWE